MRIVLSRICRNKLLIEVKKKHLIVQEHFQRQNLRLTFLPFCEQRTAALPIVYLNLPWWNGFHQSVWKIGAHCVRACLQRLKIRATARIDGCFYRMCLCCRHNPDARQWQQRLGILTELSQGNLQASASLLWWQAS
jgi:hypothetical protein